MAARFDPPDGLEGIVVIPPEEVSTELAREAIPAEIPLADAVANVSAAARLVLGLQTRRPRPRRRAASPTASTSPAAATSTRARWRSSTRPRELGALGATISGAGPTVLVWTTWQDAGKVAEALERALRRLGRGPPPPLHPPGRRRPGSRRAWERWQPALYEARAAGSARLRGAAGRIAVSFRRRHLSETCVVNPVISAPLAAAPHPLRAGPKRPGSAHFVRSSAGADTIAPMSTMLEVETDRGARRRRSRCSHFPPPPRRRSPTSAARSTRPSTSANDNGSGAHKVGSGRSPRVSPDGLSVVYLHEGPGPRPGNEARAGQWRRRPDPDVRLAGKLLPRLLARLDDDRGVARGRTRQAQAGPDRRRQRRPADDRQRLLQRLQLLAGRRRTRLLQGRQRKVPAQERRLPGPHRRRQTGRDHPRSQRSGSPLGTERQDRLRQGARREEAQVRPEERALPDESRRASRSSASPTPRSTRCCRGCSRPSGRPTATACWPSSRARTPATRSRSTPRPAPSSRSTRRASRASSAPRSRATARRCSASPAVSNRGPTTTSSRFPTRAARPRCWSRTPSNRTGAAERRPRSAEEADLAQDRDAV